ncbi:MAG: acyltransferase family protein [Bacteroidaceae bacterium]|nr:acyltransferase family protein [Bacteroidaceae bacterium]
MQRIVYLCAQISAKQSWNLPYYMDIVETCCNRESKVRLKAFDILKLYAIFLVLWGHSIQYFLSSTYYDEPIYRIIYSFHMPLFMMISGFFSISSMSQSPLDFVRKKFVQLILPTFSWVVVLGLLHILSRTNFLTQSPSLWMIPIKEAIVSILQGWFSLDPFWFLKTCFLCYLLAYLGSHLGLNKYLWMSITLVASQCVPHFEDFNLLYPCFVVGMELRENRKFYNRVCHHYLWPLGLFMIMLCFWDQFFWGDDGFWKTMIASYMHTNNQILLESFSRLYKLTIGIAGSLAFIGMACALIPQEKTNKVMSLCCSWGQYTLGVYILQTILVENILARYVVLDDLNFFVFNFCVAPIISFICLISCIYIIKIITKSPLVAFYFFGKTK